MGYVLSGEIALKNNHYYYLYRCQIIQLYSKLGLTSEWYAETYMSSEYIFILGKFKTLMALRTVIDR